MDRTDAAMEAAGGVGGRAAGSGGGGAAGGVIFTGIRRLASPEWQMPIALACGGALLVGYSLRLLVQGEATPLVGVFHLVGDALVWVSLGLGMIHGVRAAVEAIAERRLSIDILMVVGAGLAASIGHPSEGALLLFMFTLAGALEHRALTRAKDAVARLHKIMPQEALRRSADGKWEEVLPEALEPGDEILVRAGETIPADATILRGRTTVDQSALTGESLPRAVDEGDGVLAGTLNQNGSIEARVTRPVGESSLRKILELVTEAQEQRQPMQRLIDRFSTPYTAGVFLVAGLAFVWFWVFGRDAEGLDMSVFDAAYRSITLLIVASPCALVIATPTATLCGLNRAARAGLLVKGGDALERLARVHTVALDKTGTLTTGRIEVTGVFRVDASGTVSEVDIDGVDEGVGGLFRVALALEERSTHPVARAIARHAEGLGLSPVEVTDFELIAGKGISGACGGVPAHIGAIDYIGPLLPEGMRSEVRRCVDAAWERGGISAVLVFGEDAVVYELSDRIRDGAEDLIGALRRVGVKRVAMLTGDSWAVARTVGAALGIDPDDIHAELMPEQKVDRIRALRASTPGNGGSNRLAVVGDGVNDAPALALADVGLAMGGVGADAALESADVVVLNDDLRAIPWAFGLARHVQSVMFANLVFATTVIIVLAGFAIVGWIPMGIGVIGHEGSTLLVVANSLQILARRAPGAVAAGGGDAVAEG
ncbi:MAG: heavy metal translocating P-type ATPase [Phycisphaerales bacterium]